MAVVSSEGKLLVFPVGEVPEMPRGKGNKLYDIPGKKARARSELMTAVAVVPPKASLVLWSGEQQKVLEWRELQDYLGERAQRGAVLQARLAAQDRAHGSARLAAGLKRCAAVRAPSARAAPLPRAR